MLYTTEATTRELTRLVEGAVARYEAQLASFRSQVAGEKQTRTDGTTYEPYEPLGVVEWKTDELAKAWGALDLAMVVRNSDAYEAMNVRELVELVRELLEPERYNRYTPSSTNMYANANEMYKREGRDNFAAELRGWVRYSVEGETERRAGKLVETFERYLTSHQGKVAPKVLTDMLRDPAVWVAESEGRLDEMLSVFGTSVRELTEIVELGERMEADRKREEAVAAKAKREAKQAVQCVEEVYSSGYGRGRRCDKRGKWLVEFEDGTTARFCGTHLRTKTYGGKSAPDVGETFFHDGERRKVLAVSEA